MDGMNVHGLPPPLPPARTAHVPASRTGRDSPTRQAPAKDAGTNEAPPLPLLDNRIEMQYDKGLRQVIVKVIDRETEKVIEEFPAEEIQKLRLHIRRTLGALVDEEA